MILESFAVGPLGCNCTILGDEVSLEAIVIDPGDELKRIQSRLEALGVSLKQILITHAHLDHIGAAFKLKQLTGAPIYMNENDLQLLHEIDKQAAWMGLKTPEISLPDYGLADGQIVGLPNFPATVLHTPGHTQGSICLHFAPIDLLIAGDTLFAGSIGRTDLPGGNYSQIIESIQKCLLPLPDNTRVLPGHGPVTTIGAERRSNPYLHGM
jgi:glyoxylase-like metal-dependent hydrolase (beta-lactamase superfamily II)